MNQKTFDSQLFLDNFVARNGADRVMKQRITRIDANDDSVTNFNGEIRDKEKRDSAKNSHTAKVSRYRR